MVQALTLCARILGWAPAMVRAHHVYTGSSVPTGGRGEGAFVHVMQTRLAVEVWRAGADVVRIKC